MKITFPLAILLLCTRYPVVAQEDHALQFASGISSANLKKHLTIVAGEKMEGRETGTVGQRRAAAYIEDQFRQIGLMRAPLLNGYQQLFPLFQDSLVSTTLVVDGKTAIFGKDYYSQSDISESGKFKGKKIIFAGYGIDDKNYSDYTGLDVTGAVVVFFTGEPQSGGNYIISGSSQESEWSYPGTAKKLSTAAAKGAIGAFIISAGLTGFSTETILANRKSAVYYPGKSTDSIMINHAFLSHEFAGRIIRDNFDTLLETAKNGGTFEKEWAFESKLRTVFNYTKSRNVVKAANVIGIIEGTDKKDEYVFMTGHYDHLGTQDGKIYYGADDDGSGTCAVIEMAQAFAAAKKAGFGPRRTMVFMTVSGEEKGLWGSGYYSDHPVFPLESTSVDLNTDMVGRIDTERTTDDTLNYVYVIGHDKLSSELHTINESVNRKYTNLVFDYKYDDPLDQNRIYYRSDHYNFARMGVPVLFFYDGMLKADYHRPTDTVDKIYWELYEKRVKMIFHTAWEIANRDGMLKRDLPLSDAGR